MIQKYDTDTYLFGILKASTSLTSAALTGGIHAGQRPLNSELEDISINTIALTQDSAPQLGTSNINIHVPDKVVTIKGVQQLVENRERLKTLSGIVMDVVRAANIAGAGKVIENQTVIQEAAINQHYVNIRINWFIH